MTDRRVEDELDEFEVGYRYPLVFKLSDGSEVKGIYAGRDEQIARLENPSSEVPIEDIESVLIEVVSEGPE